MGYFTYHVYIPGPSIKGVVSVLKPYKKWWVLTSLQRNQVLAPRPLKVLKPPVAPLASQPGLGLAQADEAGTEPDPERDEILAAQVVGFQRVGCWLGLGVFRGDGWGRTFPFWLGIYQKVAIYGSYILCIYLCFPKCNNRFMMSKKISNGSPPKKWWMLGWCWACFCLGCSR